MRWMSITMQHSHNKPHAFGNTQLFNVSIWMWDRLKNGWLQIAWCLLWKFEALCVVHHWAATAATTAMNGIYEKSKKRANKRMNKRANIRLHRNNAIQPTTLCVLLEPDVFYVYAQGDFLELIFDFQADLFFNSKWLLADAISKKSFWLVKMINGMEKPIRNCKRKNWKSIYNSTTI